MKKSFFLISILFLSACGISAKVDARNDMEKSKAEYKACLAKNPDNISTCESAKLIYEADVKAYRTLSAGIHNGSDNTLTINNSN